MLRLIISLLFFVSGTSLSNAHDGQGEARYIANEAVMVTAEDIKVLFDPLPLTGFGTYPEVSQKDREAIMAGTPPFDGVDAVFISHAHRDHFSADAMNSFMAARAETRLVLPEQGLDMMQSAKGWSDDFLLRITSMALEFGGAPQSFVIGDIEASAVRIPHSGWPQRADVENLVYRVKLNDGVTIAHMGDADINPSHYVSYQEYWQDQTTNLAFPPYWIFLYPYGQDILKFMNVEESVGIHVPLKVPADLKASGADYFSVRGETRIIGTTGHKNCASKDFDGAEFTVCTFDASEDIRLFWGGGGEAPFGNFKTLAEHLKSENQTLGFAMNGGMYHADRKPVGYYLENGDQRQSLQTKANNDNFGLLPNGVFYIGKDAIGVMETKTFALKDLDIVSATQSGPMLVIDGDLHPKFRVNSTSKKRRNGVGVSADGESVYFAISEEPVNFHTFARLFRDDLNAPNALYLDGVVSRMFDPSSGRNDPGMPMGPIIGVVR